MAQKTYTDPYARMTDLAAQVRPNALKTSTIQGFLSPGRSYSIIFQELVSYLKDEMEHAFSDDTALQALQSKLVGGDTIRSCAETYGVNGTSLDFIEETLKSLGYRPVEPPKSHDWCVLC